MGSMQVSVFEAAGKPADSARTHFYISPQGQPDNRVVTALYANAAEVLLPAGTYDVVAEYGGTEIHRAGPVGSFEVKEGQASSATVDLKLGHLRLEVVDADGALVASSDLSAYAFPAGQRDNPSASSFTINPLDLPLRTGVAYDVVVNLDNLKLTLAAQSIEEGQDRTLRLNAGDFK